MMQLYQQEASLKKSKSKADHDCRAVRAWVEYLADQEADRGVTRHPSTLDRLDWDGFIEWRRAGHFGKANRQEQGKPELRPVRNRIITYDLKAMVAMLGWATGRKEQGAPLLETSPFRAEIRRSERWVMPKELNPSRPVMSEEVLAGIIRHAPSWQLELAMRIQLDSRSRNKAVRNLLWSDVIQQKGRWRIRFRADADKSGREAVVPIMDAKVIELLKRAPSRGIGSAPLFPSDADPTEPTGRNTLHLAEAGEGTLREVPSRAGASEDDAAAQGDGLSFAGASGCKGSCVPESSAGDPVGMGSHELAGAARHLRRSDSRRHRRGVSGSIEGRPTPRTGPGGRREE